MPLQYGSCRKPWLSSSVFSHVLPCCPCSSRSWNKHFSACNKAQLGRGSYRGLGCFAEVVRYVDFVGLASRRRELPKVADSPIAAHSSFIHGAKCNHYHKLRVNCQISNRCEVHLLEHKMVVEPLVLLFLLQLPCHHGFGVQF